MPKLTPFGPEIWSAEGPVISFFSYPYSTRMAIIRLSNGTLFAWSPVLLDDALRAEVDALGEVAHVVSPNCFHHFWLEDWKKAYPGARFYAPPRLDRRRRDLKFDAILGDAPEAAWAGDIDQVAMQGNLVLTEIVFLHRPSRTAMFADLLQNFPPDWFTGWRGVLARWDHLVSPDYGAPRELRVTFWWRKRARQSLQRILDFAPTRVFIAHGVMAPENGTEFIRKGFRWLLR
jgi:hypothetical protein